MLNNFSEAAVQTRGVFRTSEIASRLRNLEIATEKSLRSRSTIPHTITMRAIVRVQHLDALYAKERLPRATPDASIPLP